MGIPSSHARPRNTILRGRLGPALRSAWLPLILLLFTLSTVFVFGGDRGSFYRCCGHNWISSLHMTIAVNLSPEHGFQRFTHWSMDEDGIVRYEPYNRFPVGGYVGMKLATLPFGESPSARLIAARIFMLLFFVAAALMAYLSLYRLSSNRWIALTATLLAFSSFYLLYYNDMTATEGMIDLFAVMLAFHGMVVFVQEGRFRQLLVKTCIALLLGWHVLALLLPFVVFGLASDLMRARSTASAVMLSRFVASTLLRSRYILLGIVALGFGLGVLTFNFAMEYVALDGETPLTELPSFESMLRRSGVDQGFAQSSLPWAPFMEEQFLRIFRMFIPYSLLDGGNAAESPMWIPRLPGVLIGVVLSAACLVGSMFVRPRILFATLASFGFFWALPMYDYTSTHHSESIYYIGLPLVFFTIVLLWARRLTNRDGVIAAAAVAAVALFAVSSFQMSRVGYSAEAAQAAMDVEQDLRTIRTSVAGELVTVRNHHEIHRLLLHVAGHTGHALHYYLNLIIMQDEYSPSADSGFVVMRYRVDTDALLTPQNRYFFLYDSPGLTTDLMASYRSVYPSIVSTEPLARVDFGVHLDNNALYYVKAPCQREDTRAHFFLHVFPMDIDDLPHYRREYGFDNLDFRFVERGVMFDGKCMTVVDLPQYDIAGFRTGRFGDNAWSAAHVVQAPELISAYQSIVSTELIASAEFDLYIDGGKLYYVKEPCDSEDVQDPFFLHVSPTAISDLPHYRREYGFDNLDFEFEVRGVIFDGKCVASVDLPQYGIAQVTTGQYGGGSEVWRAEFTAEE